MTTTSVIARGDIVPDLTLCDDEGTAVRLRDVGKWMVLYFYPKNDTPGCTVQACDIRDHWDEFSGRDDIVIYGVSPDDAESHRKFRKKYSLPFNLLVDADHSLANAFGIWREKKSFGKSRMGIERTTVIVAPDGTVDSIKRRVKPAEHVDWLSGELLA